MVKKKKEKKLRILKEIIILVLILLGLIAILFIVLHNAHSNYQTFRENKNYFRNNPNLQIEDWMTPRTITRHFNISTENLFNSMNLPKTDANLRTPLRDICKKEKVDCNKLIQRINSFIK